jgi:PIN domain nuclease of toxin-antitoxin system
MKLLLDTHVWLWALLEPKRLIPPVAHALQEPDNEIWLSPISIWECLVLAEKGRIALDPEPVSWIRDVLKIGRFREAPLTMEVAIQSRVMDLPHPDPADRFLTATAAVFDLTLVTADERLHHCKAYRLLKA